MCLLRLPTVVMTVSAIIVFAITSGVGYSQGGDTPYQVDVNQMGQGYAIDSIDGVDNPYAAPKAIHMSEILSSAAAIRFRMSSADTSSSICPLCFKQYISHQDVSRQDVFAQGRDPLISIAQLDVALRVDNLKPLGVSNQFTIPKGKRSITLYAFSDIQAVVYPTNILHVWVYKGMVAAEILLPVGSASWRTYSSKIIENDELGRWRVYVYHIKEGGENASAVHPLFDYYSKGLSGSGGLGDGSQGSDGILSQEVKVVDSPIKRLDPLGSYSFVVKGATPPEDKK